MAILALIATLIAWTGFSAANKLPNSALLTQSTVTQHYQRTIVLLFIAYALFGIGVVPHNLFLVDYIHRELKFNLVVSGMFWSLFGVGAVIGPICVGFLADKMGTYKSLLGAYILCFFAIGIVLFNQIVIFYALSAFLVGMLIPGIVTLTSSRIIELVGVESHAAVWGKMTLSFSISQAITAYFMSYLLQIGVAYTDCFLLAALAFLFGTLVVARATTK
jgi:predicted MFS family arabinose efflux permease